MKQIIQRRKINLNSILTVLLEIPFGHGEDTIKTAFRLYSRLIWYALYYFDDSVLLCKRKKTETVFWSDPNINKLRQAGVCRCIIKLF